jgi:hypothetical protein
LEHQKGPEPQAAPKARSSEAPKPSTKALYRYMYRLYVKTTSMITRRNKSSHYVTKGAYFELVEFAYCQIHRREYSSTGRMLNCIDMHIYIFIHIYICLYIYICVD